MLLILVRLILTGSKSTATGSWDCGISWRLATSTVSDDTYMYSGAQVSFTCSGDGHFEQIPRQFGVLRNAMVSL